MENVPAQVRRLHGFPRNNSFALLTSAELVGRTELTEGSAAAAQPDADDSTSPSRIALLQLRIQLPALPTMESAQPGGEPCHAH